MTKQPMAIVALLLSVLAAGAQQTTTQTLDQCIESALKAAPLLRASRHAAESAQAAADASHSARWPTVGVSGAYSYTSETQSMEFGSAIPGIAFPKIEFGDGNVYDFALNARAPLFAGHAVLEKSRADATAARAALMDEANDRLRVIHDVRFAYFNALAAKAREDAAIHAAVRLQRHVEEIGRIRAAGMQSEESEVMATATLRDAESRVINSSAAVTTAQLTLGNTVARAGEEISPVGDIEQPLVADDTLLEMNPDSRPDVKAVTARIEQSKHLSRAQWGSLLPSLSATAAYHYAKPGVNMIENDWMDYYTLGLSANWTLWDWRARSHQVRQIRASAQSLEARRDDLTLALFTRFKTARVALQAAKDVHVKTQERVALQTQRLGMVENRWRAGMATESEYLDAQDDLGVAEHDLIASAANVRLAEADLLYAVGR